MDSSQYATCTYKGNLSYQNNFWGRWSTMRYPTVWVSLAYLALDQHQQRLQGQGLLPQNMAQMLTDIAAGVENLGKLEGACQWTEQPWVLQWKARLKSRQASQ